MEGGGELVGLAFVLVIFTMFISFFVQVGFIGVTSYKAMVVVSHLNRYEQIDPTINTSSLNTDVTTLNDQTYLTHLDNALGFNPSYMTSITSKLSSSGLTNTNEEEITTDMCYSLPLFIHNVVPVLPASFTACTGTSSLREAS